MTVYKPGEDTFLVLGHLEGLDLEGKKLLDMGTGNGEIALKAAKKGAKVTAVDKNPDALEYAEERAEEEDLDDMIEFIDSNLFADVEGKYDIAVFNPPYLPGEEGIGDEEIWRGGETGTEVTHKFLGNVSDYMRQNGSALVVCSSLADFKSLEKKYNLENVSKSEIWFETLRLLRYR